MDQWSFYKDHLGLEFGVSDCSKINMVRLRLKKILSFLSWTIAINPLKTLVLGKPLVNPR